MLLNIEKRFLLFLFGCIGTRILLVLIAKYINLQYLPYMGYLAILVSVGFFFHYFAGTRKTGVEVMGDKIWWNDLRPVHGTIYLLFAYYAIHKNRDAWIFLAVDVTFGFISFITYHYFAGNFTKLIQ